MIKREFKQGIPCKRDGDDGDSMLWAGLLMSVGEPHELAIANCQSEDGRLWRSPSRVNVDTENSFSRDMALGYLLAAARDAQTYNLLPFFTESWIHYLKKTGKLCPDATDNRSTLLPSTWWQIALVAPPKAVPWIYRATSVFQLPYLWIAALTAPPGYQRHLIACSLYLYAIVRGRSESGLFGAIARTLVKKDPRNPFFLWLSCRDVEAKQSALVLEAIAEVSNGNGKQWFIERADSEEAWKDSCGHDLDFLRNLI